MQTTTNTRVWHPQGWRDGVLPGDAERDIADATGNAMIQRVIPGIANLHSHAFQRAMAGMAERRTTAADAGLSHDSFWTWRETMYRFAAGFTPETLYAVAAQLYAEMLEAGYTSVCEFHYLHHAPDGSAYADPAAMSRALIAAARETGIRMTLLPVLYMTGGFDGRALDQRQRRFAHDIDGYLRLLDTLRIEQCDTLRIGCALHSLRAVPGDAMTAVLAALPDDSRVHIHIAEQTGEVDECLALHGSRPVQWLLDHTPVDARWTLVHATHIDDAELRGIAKSGATVAICPTTEANLGDGLFPLRDYLDAGGRWGIGSDSNSSVSPVEELRWLEYGQRLVTRRRNVAVTAPETSVGESLLRGVVGSAASSTGHSIGADGDAATTDHLVLDTEAPQFVGACDGDVLDRWIFNGNRPLVRETWVDGRCVVEQGRHVMRDAIAARFGKAMARLLAE